VPRTNTGFDDALRRHLAPAQTRAVLEVIASDLDPDTTLGEVIDAAEDLGWGDAMGEICLADLAGALLGRPPVAGAGATATATAPAREVEVDDDEEEIEVADEEADEDALDDEEADEDEDEDEEEEDEAPAPARRGKASARARAAKPPPKPAKTAAKGKAKPPPKPAKTAAKGKAKAPPKPAKPERGGKRVAVPEDPDGEAMSLEQAAKLLLPLVRKYKQATMQELEDSTGMGRRKLRFHIGQLVKHDRLVRHGMGRGTYYTIKR